MSKRDFEMIAACVYAADFGDSWDYQTDTFAPWQVADRRLKHAQALADNFQLHYPRFNRATFIAACMNGGDFTS